MIDVHCHLTDLKFANSKIEQIISDIDCCISNGTGFEDSKKILEISKNNPKIFVAIGGAYHPTADRYEDFDLLVNHKVVAIGEAGLDFWPDMTVDSKNKQIRFFDMHLQIAKKHRLPIIIHNRNASGEIFKLLDEYQELSGVFHCFNQDENVLMQILKRNFYISIGGMITYKNREALRTLLSKVPLNKILLETDAPYLPPEPDRTSINTPNNVKIVLKKLSEILKISEDEIEKITNENAHSLFSKMK